MQRLGAAAIHDLIPQVESSHFSKELFYAAGIFLVRNAIPVETLRTWREAWQSFHEIGLASGRKVNRFNPVAVEEKPPAPLSDVYRHPALLDIAEQAFGPDIALYNQRFVIKDKDSRGQVFLHQDFPYHLGWPNKASAFVALSSMTPENGGMVFLPGTHQFGYLGDAGEINPSMLPSDWPTYSPTMEPGDVALMHSLTWHRSEPHLSGPDRVLADIIYQPADDPSGIALLRGQWRTEIFIDRSNAKLFNRSRVTRLIELQTEIDGLRSGQSK